MPIAQEMNFLTLPVPVCNSFCPSLIITKCFTQPVKMIVTTTLNH